MEGPWQSGWSSVFDLAASLFLFALGTQCALAWIFALVFRALARAAQHPPYFSAWTRAWFVRALGLSALIVRFTVPLASGQDPEFFDGSAFSSACFGIYQAGKFLACWWLLEGVLAFAGRAPSRRVVRTVAWLLVVAALVSAWLIASVETLLLIQAPVVVGASLMAAYQLATLPSEQRSAGARITAGALSAQGLLWLVYVFALTRPDHGAWPLVRTPWTILTAHNSYFDLAVDVMVAAGLVVLLLQDVHRRHVEAEADRARLRVELERAQRLRSLGTLVSGVAHELNNPLTAILGFAEALGSDQRDPELARKIDVIREQALRCRRIVRSLSTFSGKGSEIFEPVPVNALFERVARGFEFELGRKRVRIVLRVPAPSPEILGDRFALEQLLANLVANALQASPSGSSVTLAARDLGHQLELIVEDEGPGFPADDQGRAFDPFFTTRTPGEGMGLGLTVAHGIVRAHGGSIRADNRAEGGARLTVRFPRRGAATAEAVPVVQLALQPAPRRAPAALELLVIEDEALLREMFAMLGRRRGWGVTLADSGNTGLELLRTGRRFDVVLCDLRMAAPSGMDLHDLLLREDPRALESFVFVTGDLHSEEATAFAARCARPIIGKPFDLEDIAARIEGVAADCSTPPG